MEWLSSPEAWGALAALVVLEIVLGVDNVIFISILASRLPVHQQDKARQIGLIAAAGMRIVLLSLVGWIIGLKEDLFTVFGVGFSGKDLILLGGGGFLLYKATTEIHHRLEGVEHTKDAGKAVTFGSVIAQVMALDIVFSIDSVITAVGMTSYIGVMITAVVISVAVMFFASKPIYAFVNRHPSVKMLALAFLLMLGVLLVAESFGAEVPKGYVYSAIAFSLFVELLNIRATKAKRAEAAVHLHEPYLEKRDLPAPETA